MQADLTSELIFLSVSFCVVHPSLPPPHDPKGRDRVLSDTRVSLMPLPQHTPHFCLALQTVIPPLSLPVHSLRDSSLHQWKNCGLKKQNSSLLRVVRGVCGFSLEAWVAPRGTHPRSSGLWVGHQTAGTECCHTHS